MVVGFEMGLVHRYDGFTSDKFRKLYRKELSQLHICVGVQVHADIFDPSERESLSLYSSDAVRGRFKKKKS